MRVKKGMEFRVDGRRPLRGPKRTGLENVEADMAEHNIDREEMEKECMNRKSNLLENGL